MASRRKPKCHTCGNFMEGHRRVGGSPVCPPGYEDQGSVAPSEKSLISPPPTPDREGLSSELYSNRPTSSSHALYTPPPNRQLRRCVSPEPLQLHQLPGGALYRRNPNWNDESAYDITRYTSPTTTQAKQWVNGRPLRDGSPAPSLVSTVLVPVDEEGHQIRDDASLTNSDSDYDQPFEWDDNASSTSSLSSNSEDSSRTISHFPERSDPAYHYPYPAPNRQKSWVSKIADYARNNRSAVTVFRARPKEIAKIERTAARHGVYAATIESSYGESDEEEYRPRSKAMVVLGKSASFVEQIAGTGSYNTGYRTPFNGDNHGHGHVRRQSHMQGTMVAHPPPVAGNSRLVMFMQLLLASIIGGCMVMYGMTYLQPQPGPVATRLQRFNVQLWNHLVG